MNLPGKLFIKVFVLLISAGLLFGCGNSAHVPVTDVSNGKNTGKASQKAHGQRYVIQQGDTLFGIAFRYDMDYRKLAQANKIPHPYRIYPGDVIYLTEGAVKNSKASSTAKSSASSNKGAATSTASATKSPSSTANTQQKNVSNSNNIKKSTESTSNGNSKSVEITKTQYSSRNSSWIWPVNGKVERFFSADGLSKGLDIVAAIGTPVRSARDGQVIYAGSRLKGYGNLIIIRHDEVYLSAYAHNRVILVEEGQAVKQGDKIAELGMSGTQSPKLHFEIRRSGKPIDPMEMLPKQ